MKKRKFNLLLQIATLCLCVAAIAFGVYSAKTASLNVSGTIGFEAHNCNVSIATTITGAATQDFGDKTTINKPAVDINATSSYKGTLNLGDLFFTDKDTVNDQAAPIKMKFAISNKSTFAIKASVTLPTSSEVTILADKDSIKIEAGSETTPTVGYITITFKINTPDTGITKLDFSQNAFKFDFTKFSTKKSEISINYDENGKFSNYYIEYGTNNVTGNTKLKWYIIGTYGADGQIQKLSTVSDLITVIENATYKMKDSITYAFISDYVLPSGDATTDATKYVPFNNNYIIGDNSHVCVSLEYPDTAPNDYAISTIRAYLNGKSIFTETNSVSNGKQTNITPKTTGTIANFFTQNTLKDSDIYTLIQTRTLKDMYIKMSNTSTNIDIPTAVEGISETDSDAFWLLSRNELNIIFDNSLPNLDGLLPTSTSATVSAGWWLRSPNSNTESAENIYHGQISSGSAFGGWLGTRPAFLI